MTQHRHATPQLTERGGEYLHSNPPPLSYTPSLANLTCYFFDRTDNSDSRCPLPPQLIFSSPLAPLFLYTCYQRQRQARKTRKEEKRGSQTERPMQRGRRERDERRSSDFISPPDASAAHRLTHRHRYGREGEFGAESSRGRSTYRREDRSGRDTEQTEVKAAACERGGRHPRHDQVRDSPGA
jgi:hypothetical protein